MAIDAVATEGQLDPTSGEVRAAAHEDEGSSAGGEPLDDVMNEDPVFDDNAVGDGIDRRAHDTTRSSTVRRALMVGLVTVLGLAGLAGWFGYRSYQDHRIAQQRNLFLQVARQGALNLTTINYVEVEADVARILNSSTGAFRDDFEKRAQPFIDVVKEARAKSEGTVTEAGVESEQADQAQVLVAVNVKTSYSAGAAQQDPRAWRMRIAVQKVADGVKVKNVEFVP